jgi:hypothetical protein
VTEIARARELLTAAVIVAAVSAAPAWAASTRAEYVAQVDPICKSAHNKQRPIIRALKRKARQLRKRGIDLEVPSKQVIGLVHRFYTPIIDIARTENDQIAAVSPAPGDESTVARWVQQRSATVNLFEGALRAFTHGKQVRSKKLIGRYFKREFTAEQIVEGFGFHVCAHDAV